MFNHSRPYSATTFDIHQDTQRFIQVLSGSRPPVSRLLNCYEGSYDNIVRSKIDNIDKKRFKRILREYPATFNSVRPLYRSLRDIIFPWMNVLFTGIPEDPGDPVLPYHQGF